MSKASEKLLEAAREVLAIVKGEQCPASITVKGEMITPDYIERLIDDTGRDRVFERARQLGWGAGTTPPMWVWNQICIDLQNERARITAAALS